MLSTDFYLVATYNPKGGHSRKLSLRITKQAPALKANEISIKGQIDLPMGLFERPALTARIAVPEEAIPSTEIQMELASNVEQLIKQHLGMSLTVGLEQENPHIRKVTLEETPS